MPADTGSGENTMPETTRHSGILIINPMESIDSLAAREFEWFIEDSIAEEDTHVLIDFENVAYISSAGLRCILNTSKTMRRRNGFVALSALSGGVRSVFATSGFDSMFPIYSSVEEALSGMKLVSRAHPGESETIFPPHARPRSEPGRS
ncbi:MAG: STAS domain-containing protein [Dehalococcoidia bacterium]|nr:STAS domain-containing protein [Dehalococcoidia bacterium]